MKKTILILMAIALSFTSAYSNDLIGVSYINPKPGSNDINPEHTFTIRFDSEINETMIMRNGPFLNVTGKINYKINYKILDDKRTLIVSSDKKFEYGNKLYLHWGGNGVFERNSFRYQVRTEPIKYKNTIDDILSKAKESGLQRPLKVNKNETLGKAKGIPDVLTELNVNYGPSEGYFFIAPFDIWERYPETYPSLMIVDNYGTPVYYHTYKEETVNKFGFFDFRKQVDGSLTYYNPENLSFIQLNNSYEKIGEFQMKNGFTADLHGMVIYPNGHYTLMCYPKKKIDMSQYVENGHPKFEIIYAVFQELDENGNVVFEWNSLDHIPPTEVSDMRSVDFVNDSTYDQIHINSVEIDHDGNYIISCRHLDQVLKISHETGEFIWRLGAGPNNDLTVTSKVHGEEPVVSAQHDARRMENGNLSIFNNCQKCPKQESSAQEYIIDEENKTAELVKVLKEDPPNYGPFMGNVQNLPESGRKVVGWGGSRPCGTEFNSDGTIALTLDFDGFNYRVYKFDWETDLFESDTDLLSFQGEIDEEVSKKLTITNNSDEELVLNNFITRDPREFWVEETEITVPAGETGEITVYFKAYRDALHEDVLTICSDTETDRVAIQVNLEGTAVVGENIGSGYFLTPKPGTIFAVPENIIAVRTGQDFTESDLDKVSIELIGNINGSYSTKAKLALDNKTINFIPEKPFENGERIDVDIYIPGIENLKYYFKVYEFIPEAGKINYNEMLTKRLAQDLGPQNFEKPTDEPLEIKDGRPVIDVTIDDSHGFAQGYFFFAPFSLPPPWFNFPDMRPTIMITDNYGTPVYYKTIYGDPDERPIGFTDFRVQSNGLLTYYSTMGEEPSFFALDSSYNKVREYKLANSYSVDIHGLVVYPEGNYTIMSYPYILMDYTRYVKDGRTKLGTTYGIMQELDDDGNLLFEWNSLDWIDPIEITPARHGHFSTDVYIDYLHVNSIEKDTDSTYLFSCRNIDEVLRVHRNTGEMIWRFGMEPGNQMTIKTDIPGEDPVFGGQHDARILPNGNISLFDNDTQSYPFESSAKEFEIDEENMIATLVDIKKNDPPIWGNIMGNVQCFPVTGKKVVGWGSGRPNITEFNSDGSQAVMFDFDGVSYRAYKFPWKTNIFESDYTKLELIEELGDTSSVKLMITNNQNEELVLNNFLVHNPDVFWVEENEITIPANGQKEITVTYTPRKDTVYYDPLTICSDTKEERIAIQVFLYGLVTTGVRDNIESVSAVNIYPNPAHNKVNLNIYLDEPENLSITLVNTLGIEEEVAMSNYYPAGRHEIEIPLQGKVSGAYFLVLKNGKGQIAKSFVINR